MPDQTQDLIMQMPARPGFTDSQPTADAWAHLDPGQPNPQASRHNSITESPAAAVPTTSRQANQLEFAVSFVRADGTAIKLVSSLKGRRFVTLQVVPSQTAGVYVSHNADLIDNSSNQPGFIYSGWHLTNTAAPITLNAEGELWVVTDTLGTASQVQLIVGNQLDDSK